MMVENKTRCLAIVPAFNERASIRGVIEEMRVHHPEFTVAVVDDGSLDDTAAVARGSAATVLQLPFNLGIGGAVQTGFAFAEQEGFDIAVQVDADGQHDPAEIGKLLAPIMQGEADVVIGSRYLHGGEFAHALHRRFLIAVFARLVTLVTGNRYTDTSSSFRAYNRRAIAICSRDFPQGYLESVESLVTLSGHGLRIVEVPVVIRQREVGTTSLSMVRTIIYSTKVAIAIAMGLMRRGPESRAGK
jgi:glycosyltransferase involved in cell wall biosynthesis